MSYRIIEFPAVLSSVLVLPVLFLCPLGLEYRTAKQSQYNYPNLNLNVTQIGMSLKLECLLNWNVPEIGRSLKWECHSNWNINKFVITLKLECHSNWNVTQIIMSLKLECHSIWNVS